MNSNLKKSMAIAIVATAVIACVGVAWFYLLKPKTGLVASWPAEGNAKAVGGKHNGILSASGVTFARGKVGMGFQFDGTNGYVKVPDSPALKPVNVTVEAWVWLDPSTPPDHGNEAIFFKKNTSSAFFEGYSLLKDHGDGSGADRFSFVISSHGNQVILRSTTATRSYCVPPRSRKEVYGIMWREPMMATNQPSGSMAWRRTRPRRDLHWITAGIRFTSAPPALGRRICACLRASLTDRPSTSAP